MSHNLNPYCGRCGVHKDQHCSESHSPAKSCPEFIEVPGINNPTNRRKMYFTEETTMADQKPLNAVSKLMQEAKEEVQKETVKKYKAEVKSLLKQRDQAVKLLANIDDQLTDLEMRISKELS